MSGEIPEAKPSATTSKESGNHGWLAALGLHRKELRAWALYDWANSAFATTVMATVLPIFYRRVAAGTLSESLRTPFWGYTAGLALLIAAVLSPILGATADYLGAKKKFLSGFALAGIAATAILYFIGRGDWLFASLVFIIANVGFAGSEVFYESLLPHIADAKEVDRVSTAGYAIGYVGGGVLLAINLMWITWPATFGMNNPLLLRVNASFEESLDAETVPAPLRQQLQEKNVTLSDAGALSVDRLERRWEIRDNERDIPLVLAQDGPTVEIVQPRHLRIEGWKVSYEGALQRGEVPQPLRRQLEENGFRLSGDADVQVTTTESRWALVDRGSRRSFLLHQRGPTLEVFAERNWPVRASFLSVALWWFVFSIPLLLHVAEPGRRLERGEAARMNPVRVGFRRLGETFGQLRRHRQVFIFLLAFWLYSDGIGTIIKMAVSYGDEIGISEGHLIGALLLVQFLGIPFTFAYGALAGLIGAKRGVYLALVVYTGIAALGYFMSRPWHFWTLAMAVGTVQGGAQALSRSLYANMVPRSKSSEFFAFYSVSAKFAGILGPLLFGAISQSFGASRPAILFLVVFFIGGMFLLSRVDVEAGHRAAQREDAEMLTAREAAEGGVGPG